LIPSTAGARGAPYTAGRELWCWGWPPCIPPGRAKNRGRSPSGLGALNGGTHC